MMRIVDGKVETVATLIVGVFLTILLLYAPQGVQGEYRYSLESCLDFVPRQYQGPTPSWGQPSSGGSIRKKRVTRNEFRITVAEQRYKRNSEIYVHLEADTYYDGMMMQGRAIRSNGHIVTGKEGLVGRFKLGKIERFNFSYLECDGQLNTTVVSNGYITSRLGNATFVWIAPDGDGEEIGDIRFFAGVTTGTRYQIIASNILHFNPFPISTTECGGTQTCLRVCPMDFKQMGTCPSKNAVLMYSYKMDLVRKQEMEFTLGGKLSSNQSSYIAVVYSEDNENLTQSDVTVCYLENGQNGRVLMGSYILEGVGTPLIPHAEEITVIDYDFDGSMLWCRYRRPIGFFPGAVINPQRSVYTFLYHGKINTQRYPNLAMLETPSRHEVFISSRKLSWSTSMDHIIYPSSSVQYNKPLPRGIILMTLFKVFYYVC